jgi:CubicO group peptidase (beta-lactamase class C family)
VMLLVEDGLLELDAPVNSYLPTYMGDGRELVTIRHLLSHNSGLPAWAETSARGNRDLALGRAMQAKLTSPPGQRVEYSDIGFVILWAAAEAAYGGQLTELLDRRVFRPLEMHFTSFQPGENCIRCAPTSVIPGFRGVVHDPIARNLGGVAGNAGLFSTAHDLAKFAAMLVNGGQLNGVRVLREETIQQFSRRQPGAGNRALGWETPDDAGSGAGGLRISRSAFGHTGFTGTSLWVDPERGTWTVLLSNRTYQEGPNRMQAIRRAINDRVATAVDRAMVDR